MKLSVDRYLTAFTDIVQPIQKQENLLQNNKVIQQIANKQKPKYRTIAFREKSSFYLLNSYPNQTSQMKQDKIHSTLREKYDYSPHKPEQSSEGSSISFKSYKAVQKDLGLQVTIKVLSGPYDSRIPSYLNKLKSSRAEQVIKLYEIISENDILAVVSQRVKYGTIQDALSGCKKLDDNDSLYIGKYLLTGFMELLRSGVEWKGSVRDIEFTEGGLKLSWNNDTKFDEDDFDEGTEKGVEIKRVLVAISKDSGVQNQQRLLPFPESKNMKELIRLCETSASEISLAPLIKKKQKYIKKKFKEYLLLKETKVNFDYFEEVDYLAVHKQHGFVKIKTFDNGNIPDNILQLNKTKSNFTKLIETFNENNKTHLISHYSNDGNLQTYINRLKTAGISLKQSQIEFFLYSLFEPIKVIQQSSIKSLNTSLHIKNIYMENGIPKIGQPIPINNSITSKFIDRSDVPDFYHPKFKQNPQSRNQSYDTYSLGVLLYKLMYTEYPIFPNNKVHIPTTPSYNSRLKTTLQIFLNEGGRLIDIEKRIEVGEDVKEQVKKNKELLIREKKSKEKHNKRQQQNNRRNRQQIYQNEDIEQLSKQKLSHDEQSDSDSELGEDCFDCCVDVADHSVDPQVQSLHQSPYKIYRLCTKLIVMLLVYILVMYMFYLGHNFSMLFQQSSLHTTNVTISTVRYEIITQSQNDFYLAFNQTDKSLNSLLSMGCLINNYNGDGNYSELVQSGSFPWIMYLLGGLLLFIAIIAMKSIAIFKFDYIKVKYNFQHAVTNYNYSNYLIQHLLIAVIMNNHFYFFNLIFFSTLPQCLGSQNREIYSYTDYMFNHKDEFLYIHTVGLLFLCLVGALHFTMVYKTDEIKYSKLYNPILLIAPFILAYWIVVRVGVLSQYFYPSALNDKDDTIMGYFTGIDHVGILGIIPEILFIIEFLINKFIDLLYWMFIDKRRRILIHESSTENIQLHN